MRWKGALCALVAGVALSLAATASGTAKTTPTQATSLTGEYTFDDQTDIVVDGHATKDEMDVAKNLSDELHARTNTNTHIIKRLMPHSIRLHLVKKWGQVNKYYGVDVSKDLGAGGYIVNVTPDGIIVVATTPAGLHNGTNTLLQSLHGHKIPATHVTN